MGNFASLIQIPHPHSPEAFFSLLSSVILGSLHFSFVSG